jgi:hypothetical protein
MRKIEPCWANEVTALDAAPAISASSKRHWRGASEFLAHQVTT